MIGWASPLPPVPMRSGAPEYGTEPEVEGELEKAGWQGDNDGDDCSNIGLCLARLGQQAMLRQARQAGPLLHHLLENRNQSAGILLSALSVLN